MAALYCSFLSLCSPGDEILVFDPSFPGYSDSVNLIGCKLISVPMKRVDTSLEYDLVSLRSKITEKTKVILMINPHSPSGVSLTREMAQ
jgi:aspartate/methionine/tyrosine aminotransferase